MESTMTFHGMSNLHLISLYQISAGLILLQLSKALHPYYFISGACKVTLILISSLSCSAGFFNKDFFLPLFALGISDWGSAASTGLHVRSKSDTFLYFSVLCYVSLCKLAVCPWRSVYLMQDFRHFTLIKASCCLLALFFRISL